MGKTKMDDLISRQDAIDAINAYLGLSAVSRTIQNMTSIQEILENLPSAEPRKKGKWILVTDNRGQHFECDKCGEWRYYQGQNFCSHCGADMRGEQNETD